MSTKHWSVLIWPRGSPRSCMSLLLQKAEPNLAVKRTPNGRPHNGIMLILTIARPAVWRRLPLRYAPGSDAWAQVEQHAQHIVFDRR
jgi:hypothetical protein